MDVNSKIIEVPGIGEKIAKSLSRVGVNNVEDLIMYFPRKYTDYSNVQKIRNIEPGEVTIRAKFENVRGRYARRGIHITEAVADDDTGKVRVVWFNQPYRKDSIKMGSTYYISGILEHSGMYYQINNPSIELVSAFPKNTARIVPIYKESKDIKSHQIRSFIKELLPVIDSISETLPGSVVESESLIPAKNAIRELHFPSSREMWLKAKQRMAFEEVFTLALASLTNKKEIKALKGSIIKFDEQIAKNFVKNLDFKMTEAQKIACWEIIQDMQKHSPMNRLLEGDVGSGKTIVAALAASVAIANKFQVAYMAPTEILAKQHCQTFLQLLQPFKVKVALLTGSQSKNERTRIVGKIKSGQYDLIVGTHALIQSEINFKNLNLVIIDEQHRFGVNQRTELQKKAGRLPHMLAMTATPIPRSLALTLYGDLDISIINQLPPGRKPPITKIISPLNKEKMYADIDKRIDEGHQVYIVCPLISDSDKLGVKSVEAEYEKLSKTVFSHRKIGMIHGKLKTEEKDKILEKLRKKQIDILISTTVIEVGVNIPSVNVIIIEGAERFGLAQLHQLRGRVGRSTDQSYCYLVPSNAKNPPRRLKEMVNNNDGFKLAEIDLDIRGPGEIYGTRQHGILDLKVAKITDINLIKKAKKSALGIIDKDINLLQYPRLAKKLEALRAVVNLN